MAQHVQLDISPQALQLFEAATAAHTRHELTNAVDLYQKTLALVPRYFPAMSNLGTALQTLRQFDQAIDTYRAALQVTDAYAAIHNNLGVALRETHRIAEAMICFDTALQIDPKYHEAWVNRGYAHHLLGQFDQAISDYEQARQIAPDFAAAPFNLSLTLLTLGDYENGWPLYEWRFLADPHMTPRSFPQPLQRLQPTHDIQKKTLLLYAEQGLGDTLQFCRFALPLLARGARVILQVPATLKTICQSLSADIQVITQEDDLPAFDFYCPLMSLPWFLDVKLPHIAHAQGYLHATPTQMKDWQQRLSHLRRQRIGLIWSGGFRPAQPESWETNHRRNLPLHFLHYFKDIPADFVSLQKGQPAEDELTQALLDNVVSLPVIHQFSADLHDFSDTAALMSQLDLIISVDTSCAHLAAALGKPTWILHRFDACWRWLQHPQDKISISRSPWYSQVTSYHQTTDGDWPHVLQLVQRDLFQFLKPS